MSLSDDIKVMQDEFKQQVSEEVVLIMQDATRRLMDSGIVKKALKTGGTMPDFSLPNANGKEISLESLLSKGPLVINFYRGGWCPYCNLELRALQNSLPEIETLGAHLVAISPNLPDKSQDSINEHDLGFEVLSDLANKLSTQCGLVYKLDEQLKPLYEEFGINLPEFSGDDSYTLPIPATYIVNTHKIVEMAFVDADYTKRCEPDEVIRVLKQLQEKEK